MSPYGFRVVLVSKNFNLEPDIRGCPTQRKTLVTRMYRVRSFSFGRH